MQAVFDRHSVACLQFSGGKDSLACLWLIRPWWNKTVVLWANTGAAFPETVELMEKVRALVPCFHEVKTDQAEQVKRNGYPVDLLPILHHRHFPQHREPKLQGFMECCWENIMNPANTEAQRLGATLLIRGQKSADKLKGPLKSGDYAGGFELLHPIEGWTDAEVMKYLEETPLKAPEHYAYVNTSLDCWSCTSFLSENVGKMKYMREKHPEKHAEVTRRLKEIQATMRGADFVEEALAA